MPLDYATSSFSVRHTTTVRLAPLLAGAGSNWVAVALAVGWVHSSICFKKKIGREKSAFLINEIS